MKIAISLMFVLTYSISDSAQAQLVSITRSGSDALATAGGASWGGTNSAENTNPVSASYYTTDPNPSQHGNSYATASMSYTIETDSFSQSGNGSIGRDNGYSIVRTSHGSSAYLWNVEVYSPVTMSLDIDYFPVGQIDLQSDGNPSQGTFDAYFQQVGVGLIERLFSDGSGLEQSISRTYDLFPGFYTLQISGFREWNFTFGDPNSALSGSFSYTASASFAPVPEPSTTTLLLTGTLLAYGLLRKRR